MLRCAVRFLPPRGVEFTMQAHVRQRGRVPGRTERAPKFAMKRIDVLSDSTGETAEKVVRAAMLQFPHSGAQIRLHTRVRTKEAARPILERAAQGGGARRLHRREPRAARVHPRVELRAQGRGARPHRLAHRQARRRSSTGSRSTCRARCSRSPTSTSAASRRSSSRSRATTARSRATSRRPTSSSSA